MLNMFKFDTTRSVTLEEAVIARKSGSFFGPFRNNKKDKMFFLSFQKPVKFDVEKYEYQQEAKSLDEGYVFALYTNSFEGTGTAKDCEENLSFAQYRSRKNMGSKLLSINLNAAQSNEIVLEYGDGDYCNGNKRYKSKVKLICQKDASALSDLNYIEDSSDGKLAQNHS